MSCTTTCPASAASIHPNKEGAKEYARCVQKIINEIETGSSDPSDPIPETTSERPVDTAPATDPEDTKHTMPTLPQPSTLSPTQSKSQDPAVFGQLLRCASLRLKDTAVTLIIFIYKINIGSRSDSES